MKLADYTGWLLATVRDGETTATELLRGLREQSSRFDPDAATAHTALRPDILRAKSGPGGGLDADPFRAAFVLLAVMLGGKRADIGHRVWHTWHMHHAGSVLSGWGDDFRGEIVLCEVTGQPLFGDALKATLANEDWARRVEKLRLSGDQFGEIVWSDGKLSRFEDRKSASGPPALIRMAEVDGLVIASTGALLKR